MDRDVTSRALLPDRRTGRARIVAQAPGVVSGIRIAQELGRLQKVRVVPKVREGDHIRTGQTVLELSGDLRAILGVERTMLNFLMHLSGVATATAKAVRAAAPLRVYATRKTLPGLRDAEKAAVVHGGGFPHRSDLASAFLIKRTHLGLVPAETAVQRAQRAARGRSVQVEVSGPREAVLVARAGADALLVDNQRPAQAKQIVDALKFAGLRQRVWVELSGGLTLRNLPSYRQVGADAASLGSLTHSAKALPFHLRWISPTVTARRAPT